MLKSSVPLNYSKNDQVYIIENKSQVYLIEVLSVVIKDLSLNLKYPCDKSREQVNDEEFGLSINYDDRGVTLSTCSNGNHPCYWESDGLELRYTFSIRIGWPIGDALAKISYTTSQNVETAIFCVNGVEYKKNKQE